jgi:hypothetical protein
MIAGKQKPHKRVGHYFKTYYLWLTSNYFYCLVGDWDKVVAGLLLCNNLSGFFVRTVLLTVVDFFSKNVSEELLSL